MKLALGTAQFGLNYGISNCSGKVGKDEIIDILSLAKANGIQTLDTAIAYGDSETVLGGVGLGGWRVITKLPPFPEGEDNVDCWVEKQMRESLERMCLESVYGILLHQPDQLFGGLGEAIRNSLARLKDKGLVEKIGVSIYQPNQLELINNVFEPDIVQAPCNVFDRRLIESGWLSRLKEQGAEIHIRSVFLQGLLLMPMSRRPKKFDQWSSLFDAWNGWLMKNELDPVSACLNFVYSIPEVDRVVVGVANSRQLQELINASLVKFSGVPADISSFDEGLINPSRW
ncbi:MAG: aldo/keto reductase [Gammaproteobacteria bacterium]|nr:MAG: aldo/keto reductase [Gammaproteobacteria bacterium]